jgi:hypothetical protein
MRRARIHIYFTTIELPNRNLEDIDFAHDVMDFDIGDNERVVQVDVVDRPVYRKATAPAQKPDEWTDLTPQVLHERTVTVRDKTMSAFRTRVVTIEEVDAVEVDQFSESIPVDASHYIAEVSEAEVVDEA